MDLRRTRIAGAKRGFKSSTAQWLALQALKETSIPLERRRERRLRVLLKMKYHPQLMKTRRSTTKMNLRQTLKRVDLRRAKYYRAH